MTYHLTRWAAAKLSLKGNPHDCELLFNLSSLYASIDPL